MKLPKSSLPTSQEPNTFSYPKPDQCSPHSQFSFLNIHFNIILSSKPKSPSWSPLRFPHKNCVHISNPTKCATCTARPIALDLINGYPVTTSCGWRRWPADIEGRCEYTEKAVADSRQGVLVHLWVCEELTTPRRQKKKKEHVTKYTKEPR